MKTPFDDLFDFDNDGELDTIEIATATAAFLDFLDGDEKKETAYALFSSGIDEDDFDMMDDDEKREALEDAGLDPDGFEFD